MQGLRVSKFTLVNESERNAADGTFRVALNQPLIKI